MLGKFENLWGIPTLKVILPILFILFFCFAAVAVQVPSTQPLAVLTASDGQPGDGLGARVATDNQGTVFGYAINAQGPAIYVYQEPAGGWHSMTQTAVLQLPPSSVVGFLSVSDDTLVVSLLNLGRFGSLYFRKAISRIDRLQHTHRYP